MTTEKMEDCLFKCGKLDINIVDCVAQGNRTIIECSKRRKDGINIEREKLLDSNENATLRCYKNCVSTYTSNAHIEHYLKKHKVSTELTYNAPEPKKVRRTVFLHFRFLEHWIFCGEMCITDNDSKNPRRW